MNRRKLRCAVVTGGARGIGLATARRLAADGYAVVVADHDEPRGRRAEELLAGTGEAMFIATDVGSEVDVAALMRRSVARYGGLDALVNNAGIADPHTGPIETLDVDDWNRRLRINLTGAFLCVKHAAGHLRERSGAIVNVASTRALQSEPDSEAYAATKGGLVALTHALAVSLGPAIRVNSVSPGWIDTSASKTDPSPSPAALTERDHAQHPVGRVGRPEDVADTIAWLLSPAAGFITAQNIVVDGGMTRRMIYET